MVTNPLAVTKGLVKLDALDALATSVHVRDVSARVVRHDGATTIVLCCTLDADREVDALTHAFVSACRDDFSSGA